MQNNFCELPEMLYKSIGANVVEQVKLLMKTTKFPNTTVNGLNNDTTIEMALKTYYMPLQSLNMNEIMNLKNSVSNSDNNLYFIDDGSPEGIKAFYKMSYKNVIKYANIEQAHKYHSLRKQYLCWVMNVAIKDTDMCYQIMGTDSPASDVDITILSKKVIIPTIEDFDKVISKFHKVNSLYFYDPIDEIFDANLYATQFLQVVSNNEKLELQTRDIKMSQTSNTKLSTETYSYGCFGYSDVVNASAFHIPTYDVKIQRQFALARLSDYMRKNIKSNVRGIETKMLSEYFIGTSQKRLEYEPLFNAMHEYMSYGESLKSMIALAKSTVEQDPVLKKVYANLMVDKPNETHKLLISASYYKRNIYLKSNTSKSQQDADNIVNLMSAATFYVNDAYHSQGAFLDVTGQDWKLDLTLDDYINSLFDNLGFLVEYADMTVHDSLNSYQRLAKMNKYFLRICNTFLKITELLQIDTNNVKLIVNDYIKNAKIIDSSRKSIDSPEQHQDFIYMLEKRVNRVLDGHFSSFNRVTLNRSLTISQSLSEVALRYAQESFRLMLLTGLDKYLNNVSDVEYLGNVKNFENTSKVKNLENAPAFIRIPSSKKYISKQSNVLRFENVGEDDNVKQNAELPTLPVPKIWNERK